MVKSVLSDDGLSDANLVHAGDPRRLGELFGADAVMYISIERWDARYAVLSTAVTVELTYTIKSAHTAQELWSNPQRVYINLRQTGWWHRRLLAHAIVAAIAKAAPNTAPGAPANNGAINIKGTGLTCGPYDGLFGKDTSTIDLMRARAAALPGLQCPGFFSSGLPSFRFLEAQQELIR